MKPALAALALLLTLGMLVPCSSHAAEAPVALASVTLHSLSPNASSHTASIPAQNEDFMAWLGRQPGQSKLLMDNCLHVCGRCSSQQLTCCTNAGGVGCYCGGPGPDGGC